MSSNSEVLDIIKRTEEANATIHDLTFNMLPNLVEDIKRNKLAMTDSQYYDIKTFSKMIHMAITDFTNYIKEVDEIIAQKPVGGTRRKRRSTRRRQTRRHR